jgi:hypothetical protein
MTILYKKSLRIHWATLLCFFLPFFHYSGCGSAEEKAEAQRVSDSIAIVEAHKTNAIVEDSIEKITNIKDTISTSKLDTTISESESVSTTEKISEPENKIEKAPTDESILRKLLYPRTDYYTGFGEVNSSLLYVGFSLVFISLFLLIITLIIKYIDKDARKAIVLLDVLSFILLYFADPPSDGEVEKLWGYWVCLTFLGVLTIYDFYVTRQQKTNVEK